MDDNELIEKLEEMSRGYDPSQRFLIGAACGKLAYYRDRNAALESQVVRMRYHDNQITQSRVFEIAWSDLLDPEEAMDIFVRNVQRIFERSGHGQ